MKFCDRLNLYIETLGCSAKTLSAASGISDAAISRYRSGEREPGRDSEQLLRLAQGICAIAAESDYSPGFSEDEVLCALRASLHTEKSDFDSAVQNLKNLLTAFGISYAELSRAMNFDASYLSRVCSGQRKPANTEEFITQVCRYVTRRCLKNDQKEALCALVGTPAEQPAKPEQYTALLIEWLCAAKQRDAESVSKFLAHLDTFDLNEYIEAIHFGEIKVPSLPFRLPASRNYYGIEEMKQGELDFFKATALSKSAAPVFMCSDMPMADMAEDLDFGKKWMFGIAVALRKGLHLDIIHNIDRPFEEMMLGLESWIPIYMTGQVSPYYLKGVQNTVYCHFHYVSGAAALTGECINGFHEDGHYHFTNNREEVQHSRRTADHLLQKAQPLMEIYKAPQADLFRAFLKNDAATVGARHNILSAPPLYTMPKDLLGRILKRSGMSAADAESINATLKQQTENIEQILTANTVIDELPHVSEEAFRASPLTLSLSNAFIENTVTYTYEEYTAHLKATKMFAERHPNYTVRFAEKPAFRNIQIQIHENEWVMLSKSKAPAIHFVIRHSKMLSAFQNMILPYVED